MNLNINHSIYKFATLLVCHLADSLTTMLLHKVLAFTNILGLYPVSKVLMKRDATLFETAIVVTTVLASVLMHLSETKHRLDPGPLLRPYSRLLLNVDRWAAIIASGYYLVIWLDRGTYDVLFVFLFGSLCSFMGEQTNNKWAYGILHSIWHLAAYIVLYSLI